MAYSRGLTSGRRITGFCQANAVLMAPSADSQSYYMTIADFISWSHGPLSLLILQTL
nr:hypothetical protein [Endozoicomonas sp. ISHI1]